ncbi:MAG: hypothetical protein KC457_37675, partial [Myxococcales bacterium]|nr:hypothetical protein [Myxococcales bacterium]
DRNHDRNGLSIGTSAAHTREVNDSGVPVVPGRRSGRCVLLHAAFSPRAGTGEHPPDPRGLLELVGDLAFKREAHVHRLDRQGALLVFGAMFDAGDDADVTERALGAATEISERIALVNAQASGEGQPHLRFGAALHVGEVIYGNIGVPERLEFSVIGPAANEVARIE